MYRSRTKVRVTNKILERLMHIDCMHKAISTCMHITITIEALNQACWHMGNNENIHHCSPPEIVCTVILTPCFLGSTINRASVQAWKIWNDFVSSQKLHMLASSSLHMHVVLQREQEWHEHQRMVNVKNSVIWAGILPKDKWKIWIVSFRKTYYKICKPQLGNNLFLQLLKPRNS